MARDADSSFGLFLTQILSDRERFFTEVVESKGLRAKLVHALWTLLALCALYGAAAGAYAGPQQALSAAIKLPLLFLGTLAICFPGFFVIQVLVGSRLRLAQVLALVLGAGLVGMAVLHEGLAFACEKRGVYPRKAVKLGKEWRFRKTILDRWLDEQMLSEDSGFRHLREPEDGE